MRNLIRFLFATAMIITSTLNAYGQNAQRLKVSDNKRFIVKADSSPFFYLGDTAWELFHRLNREEANRYLKNRADKGFTVIQAVALAELDGLNTPNPYGHRPLLDNDVTKPDVEDGAANDYWDHVDYAEVYGEWLGRRYKDAPNIIWIPGGDRALETETHKEIIRPMARGLRKGAGGAHLQTLHPRGGEGSSAHFHNDDWLDFNMRQNGHGAEFNPRYEQTRIDYDRTPTHAGESLLHRGVGETVSSYEWSPVAQFLRR